MSANQYHLLVHTVAQAADPEGVPVLRVTDRQPTPWESSMQATCDCLSWRGALDTLERRQAEDELGETVYADVPLQARPALVAAHLLMDKAIFTEDELQAKMAQVRERFERV